MRTTWLTLAAAVTLLTACQNEYSGTARDPEGVEIRLGTVVGEATRSYDLPNLRSDQRCYVWADQLNPTGRGEEIVAEPWFDAWELRTGNNQLVPWTSGDVRTYPAENSVNLYAVVGSFGDTDVKGTALPDIVGLLHSVSDDQRTAAAYYDGDLVSAALYDQWPTSETVELHFYHLLSKLQVQLVAGEDMTADELSQATVTVLDVRRNVVFKPARDADWTDAAARGAMLAEPLQADVSQGDISIGTSLTGYEDCVLPPQTVEAGRNFIRVEYSGETVWYRLEQPLTLVSGQSYRFRLTVDKVKKVQTVTPTLTAWDETAPKADVDLSYHHDWQNVSVAAIPDQTYTGQAIEPELTVMMDERVLVEGTDYSAEFSNNTNAGTAYVTITGMGSFEGSTRVAFTILKATPDITLDDTQMNLIRTEKQTRTATAKAGTVDIPASYITYASDNPAVATVNEQTGEVTATGPGTATITATVSVGDNWNSTAKTYTVSVETVSMTDADISPISSVTYTGSAHEPSFTVTYGGQRLTKGTDYSVAYADNLNAGTATVTVTGMGRYGGSKTTSFTIQKAVPVITMSATQMTVNVGSTQSRTATATAGITQIPSAYITYTSANAGIATVNATSGLVTAVAEGTTTITATVAEGQNWTAGEKKYNVEVKDGVLLSQVTSSHVGYVISSTGKAYAPGQVNGTPVAMIGYVGSDADASGSYRGLAIALTDASTGSLWGDYSTALVSYSENASDHYAFMNGIASTNTLVNNGSHPAASAARNYSVSRPSGLSAWFLPSSGQWAHAIDAICVASGYSKWWGGIWGGYYNGTDYPAVVKAKLRVAGDNSIGTAYTYWTSSQGQGKTPAFIGFGTSNQPSSFWFNNYAGSSTKYRVRAFCAF